MSGGSFWRGSGGPRGSYRGRGRGAGTGNSWRTDEAASSVPAPPKGDLLSELKREEISLSESTKDTTITDCRYVGSYSWLKDGDPTIMIPGKPPTWTPPTDNRRLEEDKGDFYRDKNAARYPTFPLEPAIQAVLKQCPQLPTQEIDIVTCASALGNLSRFARGVDKTFRLTMARVGGTVFLVRRENSSTELIPNVRGYGHTFPEEYTTWDKDVKDSVSHQRIVQYRFGGLKLMVRFEVDGYIRKKEEQSSSQLEEESWSSALDAFAALIDPENDPGPGQLQVRGGGRPIPQESIIDIKTRSAFDFKTRTVKKEIDLTHILPRLWISQIPTLVVAYHDRGLFDDIRVQDLREEIAKWEKENDSDLCRFASTLHELVEFARREQIDLEICRTQSGPLEIRRLATDGVEVLPFNLKARWLNETQSREGVNPDEEAFDDDGHHDEAMDCDSDMERGSDTQSERDYTACSSDSCGYCGHCQY